MTRPSINDRRHFLKTLGLGGATALGMAACSTKPFDEAEPLAPTSTPTGSVGEEAAAPRATPQPMTAVDAAPLEERTLVVIELNGGNDGIDTIVPYNDPAYKDLRPNIGLDTSEVIPIDGEVGWNPNMANLAQRDLAVVQGVGMPQPDLSHFESMVRWQTGDMTGEQFMATGFFGRLCDQLDVGDPVTGLSIDVAPSPALNSEKAVTLSIPDPSDGGWLMSDDDWMRQVRSGWSTLSGARDAARPLLEVGGTNMAEALEFLDTLEQLPERADDLYPGSYLGELLSTSARMLATNTGVRIIHVPWGSFDTHDEHRGSHDYQLQLLDEALAAFLTDLDDRGLADSTLVATISEFGRRPGENAGGTDHGTASMALLAGPVNGGLHGLYPSLTDLDDVDNLKMTVGMDQYYATIAERWFGIPATDVLPGSPELLTSLF